METFLSGLKTAKKVIQERGIEGLDSLIREVESNLIETTSIDPVMETRGETPKHFETTTLR